MDKVGMCTTVGFTDERYRFLSSLWSESLVGEQLEQSYESNEPKTVLKCENLKVTVPVKKKTCFGLKRDNEFLKKQNYNRASRELILLDQVSTEVHGGEILAVLGPSGAGKTLFLSALVGHPSVKGGKISGRVTLNGHIMTDEIMTGSTAFVPQRDLTVDSLTVDEHMQFAASLRLWKESQNIHRKRISELISQMNLEMCRNRELRSLSSGERRRVAIATQMIVRPSVLLLDEPLTGLDAAVADTIIVALARIAQPTPTSAHGCSVICVLHQPRPQTLRFVSKVMLLADGRVAFHGTPKETEQFYYRLNPTTETKFGAWNAILETFMARLHEPIAADDIVEAYRHEVRQDNFLRSNPMKVVRYPPLPAPIARAPWTTQMKWLLWRETIDARNVKVFDLSTVLFMTTAVIIGLWYGRSNERTSAGSQTATGLLFMVTSEIIYSNAYSVVYSFAPHVPILLREKRLYGPSAYYISKIISLIPRCVLQTVLFASVVHLSGNLGGDGGITTFLPVCGILIVTGIAATAYGCMLAGVSSGVEIAYTIAQPIDILANSMSGIFGNVSRKHSLHVSWLKFISTFFYSFESTSVLYWSSVKHLDCTGAPPGCPTSGDLVLANIGFTADHLIRDVILLFVYTLVCHSVGFVGMWIRFKSFTVY